MISDMLAPSHGLILVTGATGSGKTTTLYSCLRLLRQQYKKSIVTLEDPVEQILPGVRQSSINPSSGFSFAKGLRAILRQDPDIIMIGEIRDAETAKTALDAAYTGHLVLSTLHTTDCESTLMRLSSFDLDPFLVSHSLKGIVSQRLALTLCPQCRQPKHPTAVHIENPNPSDDAGFFSSGCETCSYRGHQGRSLLSETLMITQAVPHSIQHHDFSRLMSENEYYSFDQDIRAKIQRGELSYDYG